MGNWWSRPQSAPNSPEQENNQVLPVNVAADRKALEAYENYLNGLSSLNLYTFNFTFSHHHAYGLTRDEFHSLMDEFQIPKERRYGDHAMCVFVMYKEGETIKKTMIIFVRSEAQTYDVLVAKVTMLGALSKKRLAVAAGTSVLVSGALYLLNPVAGLLSGAVCTIITSGKAVYEKSHHDFKDVTIGYMVKQLIEAKNLVMTSRDELAFIHNGQEIPLSQ